VSIFSRELPIEQVFTRPQIIAIEVLSPEDRHSRIAEKIKNYRKFGVQHIWIVDSKTREGWNCSSGDWVRTERFVADTSMYLSLPELFAQIDLDNA
jgi:Uma2 family endonuclease